MQHVCMHLMHRTSASSAAEAANSIKARFIIYKTERNLRALYARFK